MGSAPVPRSFVRAIVVHARPDWGILFFTVFLFAAAPALFIAAAQVPGFAPALVVGGLVVLLAAAALPVPRGFRVEGERLVFERRLGGIVIPLEGVSRVEVRGDVLRGQWRVAGSGGCCGWFGSFLGADLGLARVWVTDPAQGVVLRGGVCPAVVSLADPVAFSGAVRRERGP